MIDPTADDDRRAVVNRTAQHVLQGAAIVPPRGWRVPHWHRGKGRAMVAALPHHLRCQQREQQRYRERYSTPPAHRLVLSPAGDGAHPGSQQRGLGTTYSYDVVVEVPLARVAAVRGVRGVLDTAAPSRAVFACDITVSILTRSPRS